MRVNFLAGPSVLKSKIQILKSKLWKAPTHLVVMRKAAIDQVSMKSVLKSVWEGNGERAALIRNTGDGDIAAVGSGNSPCEAQTQPDSGF